MNINWFKFIAEALLLLIRMQRVESSEAARYAEAYDVLLVKYHNLKNNKDTVQGEEGYIVQIYDHGSWRNYGLGLSHNTWTEAEIKRRKLNGKCQCRIVQIKIVEQP